MYASLPARILHAAVAGVALLAAAAEAAESNTEGTVAVLHPLTLIKRGDLDFGTVAPVTGAGTVTIDPTTKAVSTTGGVQVLGGTPYPAMFTGAANQKSVVIVRIPKQPITVRRVGGTETMVVSNFKLEGLDKREAAAKVAFDFHVGATLNVSANQREGAYIGTFDVTVQYP